MTNPDDVVRVRARLGGRASVYEANGWCQTYSTGLLEGNGVLQNTSADMNVLVGGSSAKPDVVIATNPSGYKIALDLVGQTTLAITAPSSNSRISSIVAYTDDLSLTTSDATVTGSPDTCGIIVVNGSSASSPTAPDDTAIRTAITSDGATGSQAAYCVIANVTVGSSTTTITDSLIEMTTAKTDPSNSGVETSPVTITFNYSGITTGTGIATLIKLSDNLGVLTYNGSTGFADAATGTREIIADFGAAGFSSVLGGTVNSWYAGNTEAYQTYAAISKTTFKIDSYVYKASTEQQVRHMSFTIFGTF